VFRGEWGAMTPDPGIIASPEAPIELWPRYCQYRSSPETVEGCLRDLARRRREAFASGAGLLGPRKT